MIAPIRLPIEPHDPDAPVPAEAIDLVAAVLLEVVQEAEDQRSVKPPAKPTRRRRQAGVTEFF